MHTNNKKMQINSFQKTIALATGHLSILGCNLSMEVYFLGKCLAYGIGAKDIQDRRQTLKDDYRKTTVVVEKTLKRLNTGFMKPQLTQIVTCPTQNTTDGSDLQSFSTIFRYGKVSVLCFLLNCPFITAKERYD